MTREQRIVEAFVEFADTLVEDFDVVEFLHRVADRCVSLLDCVEAGVLLADATGVLRVMASSSERSDALELLQAQNEEGPCFECYHRGRLVVSEDLAADAGRPGAIDCLVRAVDWCPASASAAHGLRLDALAGERDQVWVATGRGPYLLGPRPVALDSTARRS